MVLNKLKLFGCVFLAVAGVVFWSSCQAPSPLYGTWASNTKETEITLVPDGSCTIRALGTDHGDASYEVNLNVIAFTLSNGTVVSEWDIRANVMYLTWTEESGQTYNLTLYKIKN